jgi:hypothetical protein
MKKTIFLISNFDDISKINNTISENSNCIIYSLNYQTHKLLTKNKIQTVIAESILTQSDRESIDQKSFNATISWYQNNFLKKYLIFNELNLGSLLELELIQYFGNIFKEAMMLTRIIEKEKPNKIISCTFLNKFVEKLGKTMDIEVATIFDSIQLAKLYHDEINIKFNFGKIPISLIISPNLFNSIKKLTEKLINFFFHFKPSISTLNTKSILLLNFNTLQYDKLIDELSNAEKNVFLLNLRRPAIWNWASFKIIKNSKSHILPLSLFEKELTSKISSEIKSFNDNLSNMWKFNDVFEKYFVIDDYSFWSSIKQDFITICESRFKESIKRLILLDNLFLKSNISVILMWAETGQEEKEILFMSKKHNIETLVLQHFLFSDSVLMQKYDRFALGPSYPFESDKQIIWDQFTKQQAISFKHKEDKLLLTGSPRHDNFFISEKNKNSTGIIILATTSASDRLSSVMSPFDSYVKFENFIKEVCRIVKNIPDKKLIIKTHPHSESLNNITELIKEIDPQIQIIYDTNLIELINNCDLLITFNNSTIALESIILEKPTISLQFEKWAEDDNIVKSNAILSISTLGDIEKGITDLLFDKKFKNIMNENAQKFLKSFVNCGTSSQNLVKILDNY